MRFRDVDVNFDLTYKDHQSWSKLLFILLFIASYLESAISCKLRVWILLKGVVEKNQGFISWFKFTLKPPDSMVHENFSSTIWDTFDCNVWSNLDSRHLMTYPRTLFDHFWHMSTFSNPRTIWVFSKIGYLQKIIFFSMKEQQVFHKSL